MTERLPLQLFVARARARLLYRRIWRITKNLRELDRSEARKWARDSFRADPGTSDIEALNARVAEGEKTLNNAIKFMGLAHAK